jgi:SsrA-binding protein
VALTPRIAYRAAVVTRAPETNEIVAIANNRKALFEYEVSEDVEAGIVLRGTEVKSLREGKAQLTDAWAEVVGGEVFLHQLYVPEYAFGNVFNHQARRTRKLLLHRQEIDRLGRRVSEKGYTLIPLELYFKNGRAKVKLGVCRGKKQYDKRASVKARDVRRAIERSDE